MSKRIAMSREPSLNSSQETILFIKKVEEKRKVLTEAESDYNRLCNKVDKTHLELAGLKMERFKVEGLVQELNIRVRVYEMREKELKDQVERAKRSIEESKNRLAQEIQVRDSFDRKFSHSVIEMSTKYCQFKDSCYKTNVVASLLELKTSYASLTAEIERKMRNLGLEESRENEEEDGIRSDLLLQMYQPTMNHEYDIPDLRVLQELVQAELDSVKVKNARATTHIDQLLQRKTDLLEVMNSLTKAWNN